MGKGRAVGGGAGAAPRVDDLILVQVVLRCAAGNRETEACVHRPDVGEVETRVHLAGGFGAGPRGLFEVAGVVAHQHVRAGGEVRARAFERTARNHVHGAGERGAGHVRGGGKRNLHAGEVVDRDHVERRVASGAAAGMSRRQAEAVDGDRHVRAGHAVDRHFAGEATGAFDRDAGEKFHELRHVALRDETEFVGGDHRAQVRREALLVDRDRRAFHLLRRSHDETIEPHRVRVPGGGGLGPAQRKIDDRALTGCDVGRRGIEGQAGVEDLQSDRARRHTGKAKVTAGIGERFLARRFEHDAGILEVVAAAGTRHATFDAAVTGRIRTPGRISSRGGKYRRERSDQTQEQGNPDRHGVRRGKETLNQQAEKMG